MGGGKRADKTRLFSFYEKPRAVFRMGNCIDCSNLCISLSYGSWSLNCNLFFRLADGGGEGAVWHGEAGWVCVERVRFQSTTLRKAVAQLPKAQLLQSEGGSLAAAL